MRILLTEHRVQEIVVDTFSVRFDCFIFRRLFSFVPFCNVVTCLLHFAALHRTDSLSVNVFDDFSLLCIAAWEHSTWEQVSGIQQSV